MKEQSLRRERRERRGHRGERSGCFKARPGLSKSWVETLDQEWARFAVSYFLVRKRVESRREEAEDWPSTPNVSAMQNAANSH